MIASLINDQTNVIFESCQKICLRTAFELVELEWEVQKGTQKVSERE